MSLVASAHMHLKKKRESPRASSSPGSGVTSPRNAALSPRHAAPDDDIVHVGTVEESPIIVATLPEGVRRNVRTSDGPMQMHNGEPAGFSPPQYAQQQKQFARPPVPSHSHGRGFGHGIHALDTSGEYVVEGHHTAQYRQHPPRSPSPSNQQYYQRDRPPPSPPRAHYNNSVDQSFESATRYQGNYTHNLLPRAPRSANKPRRRYDSITGAPSDADEDDVMDESSVALESADDQPQAFDPFAPSTFSASPRASPAFLGRASPAFQAGAFPPEQLASMAMPPSPGNRVRMSPDVYVADNSAQGMSPHDSNPALATIEGNDNFVYDPEDMPSDDPPSLMNNYDFEYHTEKDEGSTFDGGEHQPPPLVNESTIEQARRNLDIAPSSPSKTIDEQTVGSEQALAGTPIKKKEHSVKKKKRRGHKSKVVIDNAPVEGEEEQNGFVEEDSLSEQNNLRGDIAAHARRIATSGSDGGSAGTGASARGLPPRLPHARKKAELLDTESVGSSRSRPSRRKGPFDDFSNTATSGPQVIGASKSWDSQDRSRGGMNAPSFGSFSKDIVWEDDDSRGRKTGAGGISKLVRASKSWDEDHSTQGGQQGGIEMFGTWGDQPFGGEEDGPKFARLAGEGSDKENFEREGLLKTQDDAANAKALAEWDKAEAEWQDNMSEVKDDPAADEGRKEAGKPPPLMGVAALPALAPKKSPHPWNRPDGEQPVKDVGFADFDAEPSVFSELTGSALSGMGNRRKEIAVDGNSEDEDSIFEFERNGRRPEGPSGDSPDQQHTKSIFSQINSGLKQADKAKKRSLGIHPSDSEGSNDRSEDVELAKEEQLLKRVQDSPASETSDERGHTRKESSGQRISFAPESPMVHRYVAPNNSEDTRGSTEEVSLTEKIADESPKARRRLQNQRSRSLSPGGSTDDVDDNDTFESTLGDESLTYNSGKSGQSDGKTKDGDLGFIEHVEMGLVAIGGLLGLGAAGEGSLKTDVEKSENTRTNVSGGDGVRRISSTATDEERSIETDPDNDTFGESTLQSTQYTSNTGPTETTRSEENDWLGSIGNQLTRMLFPEHADDATAATSRDLGSTTYYNEESTSNDDDAYLLQQALAAARAIHHVQGVEYDETQEINVLTDIKFVVATVKLPLGLLFQEHEIGVWVSRVVPEGNGHRKGVQHGDQLAAINGKSSVHTTINEVAETISSTPTNTGVELTFLRYVGPLRPMPGSVIQEGFEVTDASVSKKLKNKVNLFARRSSKNTPPASPGTSARRFGLHSSPKSPKRSPGMSTSRSFAASKASKQGSNSHADLTLPTLEPAGQQQSTKTKKKTLGKKLLSFKKKS